MAWPTICAMMPKKYPQSAKTMNRKLLFLLVRALKDLMTVAARDKPSELCLT